MEGTHEITNFMKNFNLSSLNSNILISDLNTIIYAQTSELDNKYLNKNLDIDIKDIIDIWSKTEYSEDLFIMLNNNFKKIIKDDDTEYSAQMIFPIYISKILSGFVFFFRLRGDYIESSSKAPKTICKFLQDFLNQKEQKVCDLQARTEFVIDENDLEILNEKIEDNMNILNSNEDYKQLNKKLSEVVNSIHMIIQNDKELQKKFLEYEKLVVDDSLYSNYLSYIIGMREGSKLQKIK